MHMLRRYVFFLDLFEEYISEFGCIPVLPFHLAIKRATPFSLQLKKLALSSSISLRLNSECQVSKYLALAKTQQEQ